MAAQHQWLIRNLHAVNYLKVAVPTPLRGTFDYRLPPGLSMDSIKPGQRVRVPFGKRDVIGIILGFTTTPTIAADRIRDIHELIDHEAALPPALLQVYLWASQYYHFPVGQALMTSLPAPIRRGRALTPSTRSAPLPPPLPAQERQTPPPLNAAQQLAVEGISTRLGGYSCILLEGITGSGKTEVYLRAISEVLARGQQVLVMVPEIGLTPQTISRFRARLDTALVTLHSNLTDIERFNAWLYARAGQAGVVIGTRSSVFIPLAAPGLIIVDEEHDASFKQQEGFRYSARDLAIYRASKEQIPVILGSATPSLETLNNALSGRYQHLQLPQRAGEAQLPRFRFIDLRGEALQEGFASSLLAEIGFHLKQGQQVLVFINRRGFAPILQCHDCGWIATCQRCDMSYTLHQHPPGLNCHHCETSRPLPLACPECNSHSLLPIGVGTERSEQFLAGQFPDVPVLRVDRDSTRQKDAFADIMQQVHGGEPCILIGTQMLAKGHHFPNVTLVAVLEAEAGLFSANFRGQELLGQILTQVAGRAGRGKQRGDVLIQTHHSDHPGLRCLVEEGYAPFAQALLEQRRRQALPPFRYHVLLRAEATRRHLPLAFLKQAAHLASALSTQVTLLGPLPAPLEKRAGRFRFQLLLEADTRPALHQLLDNLLPQLENDDNARRVRWSVDVDPLDHT